MHKPVAFRMVVLAALGVAAATVAAQPGASPASPGASEATASAALQRAMVFAAWPAARALEPAAPAQAPAQAQAQATQAIAVQRSAAATEVDAVSGASRRNRAADTVHLLLGWATVIAGGLTGALNPEVVSTDVHHTLGWVTAGLAAGTLATGAWAHHGDVGPAAGLSPANVHAMLGIAGGLMMAATPLVASGQGELHAALGEGGELLMGVAVVWPLVFAPR